MDCPKCGVELQLGQIYREPGPVEFVYQCYNIFCDNDDAFPLETETQREVK